MSFHDADVHAYLTRATEGLPVSLPTATLPEVKSFFEAAGDVMEGGEALITGGLFGRWKGLKKAIKASKKVFAGAGTALSTYKELSPEERTEVRKHYNDTFDLRNDKAENLIEKHMFGAVEFAQWIAIGAVVLPKVLNIVQLRSILNAAN